MARNRTARNTIDRIRVWGGTGPASVCGPVQTLAKPVPPVHDLTTSFSSNTSVPLHAETHIAIVTREHHHQVIKHTAARSAQRLFFGWLLPAAAWFRARDRVPGYALAATWPTKSKRSLDRCGRRCIFVQRRDGSRARHGLRSCLTVRGFSRG